MSTNAAALEVDLETIRKPILKTYSRRTLTRRISSPPVPVIRYDPRLTQSFTVTTTQPRTPTPENLQQSGFSVPGPRRVRFSANARNRKSPTDLFFEMVGSSNPELLLSQRDGQQEEVVLLSTEVDDDDSRENKNSSDELLEFSSGKNEVEQFASHKSAVRAADEEPVLKDENDIDEPEEEVAVNDEAGDSVEISPVSSAWQSSPIRRCVPSKPKTKGRFLTFKKADDRDDFKSVEKRPKTPASERLNLKVLKRTSDGFNSDEKHASPYRKQRRINNDMRMGSLELTQKGTFTQKLQGPTWLRGQKKTHTASLANLWSRRKYLGSAQVKTGSEDPLDSFEEQTVPHAKLDAENGSRKPRQISIEESNDSDEEVDLLVFPPDDVDDDDGENLEDDDELALIVEPDELGGEHHAEAHDEDVGLLVLPRTDPLDSDENAGLEGRSKNENRLPPKQQWHHQAISANRLALRPDDRWRQDVRKVPETPLSRKRRAA